MACSVSVFNSVTAHLGWKFIKVMFLLNLHVVCNYLVSPCKFYVNFKHSNEVWGHCKLRIGLSLAVKTIRTCSSTNGQQFHCISCQIFKVCVVVVIVTIWINVFFASCKRTTQRQVRVVLFLTLQSLPWCHVKCLVFLQVCCSSQCLSGWRT